MAFRSSNHFLYTEGVLYTNSGFMPIGSMETAETSSALLDAVFISAVAAGTSEALLEVLLAPCLGGILPRSEGWTDKA